MLQRMFDRHEAVRPELVEQLLGRILSKSAGGALPLLQLLQKITTTHGHHMTFATLKVRAAYDFLCHLPAEVGCALVDATLPLVRLHASLSDSLLLVLRKALFHREANARCVAVHGYLRLLRLFGGMDSSAITASSSAGSGRAAAAAASTVTDGAGGAERHQLLCQEVAGTLRRVVAQQREVREYLYVGLASPGLREGAAGAAIAPLADLLELQLRRACLVTEDRTMLNLDHLLRDSGGRVERQEPLGALLTAVQALCRPKAGDSQGRSAALALFDGLARTLTRCDMEDFELDKAADFTQSTSVGQRNRAVAVTLLEAYECALSHVARQDLDVDSAQAICTLQRKHQTVYDCLREAHKQHKTEAPLPTVGAYVEGAALARLLSTLTTDEVPERTAPCSVLRSKPNLTTFLLDVAGVRVAQSRTRVGSASGSASSASTTVGSSAGTTLLSGQELLEVACSAAAEVAHTPATSLVRKLYDDKSDKGKHALRAQVVDLMTSCLVAAAAQEAGGGSAVLAACLTALEQTLYAAPSAR